MVSNERPSTDAANGSADQAATNDFDFRNRATRDSVSHELLLAFYFRINVELLAGP